MCRKSKIRCSGLICLVLLLAFVINSSVGAKTIIWVSDNKTPTGGVAADQAWVDLLVAQGYDVDLSFRNQEGRTLDATKIAALNAADLIIVSRDISSGSYDDGEEPTQWNSITTPLILQIAHITRSNRWRWLDMTGSDDSLPPAMEAVELSHYVFTGVALGANNQVSVITEASSFANTTDAGNGTLIGRRADNGQVWIVEWEAGQEFYAGSGQTAAGARMHFASGTDSGVDGRYNLTADGEKMFLNAVRYMLGEMGDPEKASNPDPADGATEVPRDVVLSWTPGRYAPPINGHKVYFSENFNDVNDGIGGIMQDANSYAPPQHLDFNKTYYWRVDEVNGPPDFTVYKGAVWQFTVEPFAYPIAGENITATASSSNTADEGPENTINGSGLDANDLHSDDSKAMWLSSAVGPQPTWIQYEFDQVYKLHQMLVWNHNSSVEPIIGFGIKDATIEYSTDGANWTTLATVEFARAPGAAGYAPNTTVDLGGAVAKYVKITANSNWGGIVPQYGLSEVRFFYIPVLARELNPASGTIDSDVDNVTLSWRAGREAASHNLYFSTEEQAVINESINPVSIPADRSYANYDTGALDLDQTYYWKINEVNEARTPTTWQGDVLNFSTQEYLVVDDIEDYNDFEPDRVFDTWIDGWGVPENGSQVGYAEPTFVETTIVHGGDQSMPLFYDNTTASYSEATANIANLKVGHDWTKYGIKALSLFFYGDPNNTVAEKLYVKLNGVKVAYDGDAEILARTAWQQWNIDLKDFTGVNLSNITELSIGLERSGAVGGKGVVYIDDLRLYPSRCLPELVKPAADLNNDCQVNYLDLEIMAGDWLLNDYTLATAAPNPAGLIGHWPFDGNLNDISGSGSNGNPSGSPLYVAGHIGQAISLDGATQCVAIGGFSQIQSVPEVTIAMWAKADVVTGTHTMWFTDETGSYGRIRCRVNNGNWQWMCGQATTSENIQITSPAIGGVWTHFTGVRSNNNKLELFIDGVSKGTQLFAEPGPHSDQSSIGGERRSPTDIRDRFDGLIDDVRVYKYALSAAEAAYLADESPEDGQLYVPVQSVADLYDAEPVYYKRINFKDYAALANGWLDEQLWPQP